MPPHSDSPQRSARLAAPIHDPRVRAAVVAGFLLLVAAAFGTLQASRWNAEDNRLVRHTLEVRGLAAALVIEVQAAESAQRGYMLTGDPAYLPPVEAARQRIPRIEAALGDLTHDNPSQQVRLAALRPVLANKLAFIDRAVALERQGRGDEAVGLIRTSYGRDLAIRIRSIADGVDAEEASLLAARTAKAARSRGIQTTAIVTALALAVLLATGISLAARRYSRSLEELTGRLSAEIDERQRTEAQLRQAQKMEAIGQLTGGIAHDFNNMLAIIIGNLDMLGRRISPDDAPLRRLLDASLGGAQRAADLTQRLLAFSRLQPLAPASVNVASCITETAELLRRSLGEAVTIDTVITDDLWSAFVDLPQLESAIVNLAVNARDAMAEGGRLTLEATNEHFDESAARQADTEPGEYVMVSISDTGTGMSSDVLARAIDPFFTTKRVGAGTGLGLSQVFGFVKQSGEHLRLYSEPGVGTTVKLFFPRSEDAGPRVKAAAPWVPGSARDPAKVLVVEDEEAVRRFTAAALGDLGYSVLEADSAERGLALLNLHGDIDLLLTDVVMPHTNGRDLAAEAIRRRPRLKVAFMTGYTRDAVFHNGVVDDGVHLLTKPFTIAQLERHIDAALEPRGEPATAPTADPAA